VRRGGKDGPGGRKNFQGDSCPPRPSTSRAYGNDLIFISVCAVVVSVLLVGIKMITNLSYDPYIH